MLIDFFLHLRRHKLPCSLRELLDLHGALGARLASVDMEAFYLLARCVLVKDEGHLDRFDRAFAEYYEGLDAIPLLPESLPEEWLRQEFERLLSEEERALLQSLGGLDKLLETLNQRLREQKERHAGGNKWVGTGGSSPFGHGGYHPEGIRLGGEGRHGRGTKVWEARQYRNFSDENALGQRAIQLALRKLRRWVRKGSPSELDLDDTIQSSARQGWLDVKLRPERHNGVKLLVFFDVGGSMDAHVAEVQRLFSALRHEFKHLVFFYFHNCLYDFVWQDNARRTEERFDTLRLLRTYGSDYRVIFVGDAKMGPYEITWPGGSVEYWNEEPGQVWLERLQHHFPRMVWINPLPRQEWLWHPSIKLMNELVGGRMHPLTLAGLSAAIDQL
ncbi:VWA domain-containing protein [Aeromonas taiwanensis]|uniref:VWA domain-containing protein n=1 Tax=Aeromonas taiwanensis TaxID=633417 RepID=A0A5F0KB54_9GAMM|nr:VWA domain-containing protein [Aeromonas taiwanensis]TFF75538.1 VWA domain-containing protein [Aeromonas taiwanensis]TFF75669.1 VWA domain-containing protein [Aeromonas taiwanensis]TFF79827.1 VWA domain-containing protein [Aeromonas taiwanensis]